MVTSPILLTSILSIPLGPRVVRTVSATILAAVMLFLCASLPVVLPVPSLRMRTGTPPADADIVFTHTFDSEIVNESEKPILKVYSKSDPQNKATNANTADMQLIQSPLLHQDLFGRN